MFSSRNEEFKRRVYLSQVGKYVPYLWFTQHLLNDI